MKRYDYELCTLKGEDVFGIVDYNRGSAAGPCNSTRAIAVCKERYYAERIVEALNRAIEGAEREATNGHGQGHTTNSE